MTRADWKFMGHITVTLTVAMLVAVPWAMGMLYIAQVMGWLN